MTKRLSVILFILVVLLCAASSTLHAQANNPACFAVVSCSWTDLWGSGCGTLIPGVFGCAGVPFEFRSDCEVMSPNCPPPDGNCPGCNTAGSPISLATGNTFIQETDVRIPGLSNGLILDRTWNSQWPSSQSAFQIGLFGPHWRSTYEERVFVGSDNYIKYAHSDGSFWSFGMATYGVWKPAAPANVAVTLVWDPNGGWTMTFQNGEQRVFNPTSGSLMKIVDRNGNTTVLSYDALNRLTTVTDPAGRHLYFSYPNNTSFLVTGVTSDVGLSLSYAYDGQNRLATVTKPDLTTVSFTYDSNSMITAVKDSNGKILESHTYDSSGRGLTSSRANGVDAVTVSYQ